MRTESHWARGLVGLGLGLIVALGAPSAFAKDSASSSSAKANGNEKKKLLVGAFTGSKSAQARKSVIEALKEDGAYDVVESTDVKPGSDDKSYASASDGAAAVLVGNVKKSGLVLSIRNGADGTLIQDLEIKADSPAKLNTAITETLGTSIADPLSQAKPAAADASRATEETPKANEEQEKPAEAEDASSASESSAPSNALTPLELTAGLRAVHRSFSYHDTPNELFPQHPGLYKPPVYNLPLGPAVFIDGTLYPLAFGSRGAGAVFGITGGFELNVATKSVYGTPERTLTTRANQWYGGIKGRIPVAAHEFGIVAAYGQQVFKLIGDESNPQVPDVLYKFVKLSGEGRFRFDALTLGFHVGTRLVRDTGALERAPWFPGRVKTQELDAGVSVGYAVASGLDLLLGFDVTRYAFNLNPQPAGVNPYTTLIAGGAVDQYTSAWLGLRYSLANHASD